MVDVVFVAREAPSRQQGYRLLRCIIGGATAIGLPKVFDAYDNAQDAAEGLAIKYGIDIFWKNIKKTVE